jgi:decaprenylphospho-beta-D-erythro-pentofuranosid-2-ulose 2-reductase
MTTQKRILIFGATSAICTEIAKCYAHDGANFFLVARDQQKLDSSTSSITAAGGDVLGQYCYNFNDQQQHDDVLNQAKTRLGEFDLVMIGHGSLPNQKACESIQDSLSLAIEDNLSSVLLIATAVASLLEQQGHGTLAVISSVAGDRGRKSNYHYGACKSAVNTLMEGLHGRFLGSAVTVVNIKPGMIDTPMTHDMKKGILWATPEAIAPVIVRGISRGKAVIYAPAYWRYIMWIIKAMPRGILGRLSI